MIWTRASTIGRGSTATVSLAAAASGELFAAKSAELSLSAPLQKEQTILSKLDSPYVVKYKGFDVTEENDGGDDNKLFYNLFMEYHPRGTLSDEIRRLGGKVEEPTMRLYTWQILKGLEYLHSNGIVHCDIKSSNILMGKEGLKISDLGCSKVLGDDNRLVICGTPMFMPPEVVLSQGQGFEADMWSLGCTVIEMATGKNPWPRVRDPVSALHRIGFSGESPEIPGWLSREGKDFLGTCLERNPRERLAAKELLKHPFFDGLSSLGFEKERVVGELEASPRSVFDQSAWDSGSDHHDHDHASSLDCSDHVAERIERLISDDRQDVSLVSSSGWSLDDDDEEDWITVRSNNHEISDAINYFSNESLSLGAHVISGIIRKRCFTIAFDERVEYDHVPRNYLRFKKRNENFRSFQYPLVYSPLYFCFYFHILFHMFVHIYSY